MSDKTADAPQGDQEETINRSPIVGGIYNIKGDPEHEKILCVATIDVDRGLFFTFNEGLSERRVNDMIELELAWRPSDSPATTHAALIRLENKIAKLERDIRKLQNAK